MCGLVGMAGPGINSWDLSFLQEISYACGLRGQDGTGIVQGYVGKRRSEWMIEKSWYPVANFLRMHLGSKKGNKLLFNAVMDNFFLVHTRAATRGAIQDSNCHPFEKENIIGMHNGTLRDSCYIHANKTDSEMMYEHMDRDGVAPVLASLHKDSAWAIAAFDTRTNEVILGRNHLRPLCFAVNKKRPVVYWASEVGMLRWVADRNDIELEQVFDCTPNHIYRFCPWKDVRTKQNPSWRKVDIFKTIPKKEEPKTENEKTILGLLTHRPHATSVPKVSNVKPKVEIKQKKDKKGRQFDTYCLTCGGEMTLHDQFLGKEVFPKTFICEMCVKIEEVQLAVSDLQKTIH